jgi:membrane protein implicated in regulation of membrane protease activity
VCDGHGGEARLRSDQLSSSERGGHDREGEDVGGSHGTVEEDVAGGAGRARWGGRGCRGRPVEEDVRGTSFKGHLVQLKRLSLTNCISQQLLG